MSDRDAPPVNHSSRTRSDFSHRDEARQDFFDSMLMYGWLSDRNHKIIGINKSLWAWIEEQRNLANAQKDPKRAEPMDRLLQGLKGGNIDLSILLRQILWDPEDVIVPLIIREIDAITQTVESIGKNDPKDYELDSDVAVDGVMAHEYSVRKIIRVVNDGKDILAGLRIVKAGAIRMFSDNERDRVDLINVCNIKKTEEGWTVENFQGQLQQAWSRVKAVVREGTKAGTLSLMGRNMSHNIGSHALFYLEQDETDESKSRPPAHSSARLYRYLRERMELLAGFATAIPLSTTSKHLEKLVDDFKGNELLLERIAKSEGVEKVHINYKGHDYDVALPGGVIGAQILYAIFENNIRDSAKHGRKRSVERLTDDSETSRSIEMNIIVSEPDEDQLKEDFIKVTVSDTRGNYEEAKSKIENSLNTLRISDEVGRLIPGDWGIKERFIAAALLRGVRLENIPVQQEENGRHVVNLNIGKYAPQGLPILSIEEVEGNLGWVFYLMKPKDILLISDQARQSEVPAELKDRITVRDLKWLEQNISNPPSIRHSFMVFCPNTQDDLTKLEKNSDKLPYRVFVCRTDETVLPVSSVFAPIDKEGVDLAGLSSVTLYRKWVDWLARKKGVELPVTVFAGTVLAGKENPRILALDRSLNTFHWMDYTEGSLAAKTVVLFDSHGSCKEQEGEQDPVTWKENEKPLGEKSIYYETHNSGDLMRDVANVARNQFRKKTLEPATLGFSYLEAGLTRILIVDERLDPISESIPYKVDARWSCSYKELFRWRDIDIRGAEFRAERLPTEEELITWVEGQGYDFLFLHKGVIDKLVTTPEATDQLFGRLKQHVNHIIIHSGRMSMGELPPGVKFMSLANVDRWIKDNYSKIQILEELCLLRRV